MENLKTLVEELNNKLGTEKFQYVPKKDVPAGARCGNTAAARQVLTGELFNIKQFTKEVLRKEYQPTKRAKKTAEKQVYELMGDGFTTETIKNNKDKLLSLLKDDDEARNILERLKNQAIKNEEKISSIKKREKEIEAFFDSL